MTERGSVTIGWPRFVWLAAALIGMGALASYVALSFRSAPAPPPAASAASAPPRSSPEDGATASNTTAREIVVTLTPEAIQRAGIEVVPVNATLAGAAGAELRIPSVVQPNGYHTVKITPLVAGRITRVAAELGQTVKAGQTLAELYSPEMTEAETRYLSLVAELDAHERMLRRTEKLVEIGSASRQELEQVHAEHTAATTAVESARSRLLLFGMTADEVARLSPPTPPVATVRISSPIAGTVTERQANVGANVDTATALFTVVDLSTVWIVGNVYEKDFAVVRTGGPVTIVARALPDLVLRGRVTYVDPQLNAESRTAQVRVEVPNPGGRFKPNMYADMTLHGVTRSSTAVTVPRTAIQPAGDATVVYLAGPAEGQFIEREVRLGSVAGDGVEVLSGLTSGDRVVTKGSFALRAERERLGLQSRP